MREFFDWFTHMENTKPLALVLFFITFVGVIVYVFSNRKRSQRLESYKYIPLDDEDDASGKQPAGKKHEH